MNDRKIIALPDNLKTQLGVTSGSKIEVLTGHGEAQIKVAKEVQSTGWRWLSPILTFLTTVGFVAYFLVRNSYQIPLSGSESLTTLILTLTTLACYISFGANLIHLKRKKVATIEAFTWRSFPTLTIAAALIYFMVMSGLFWIGGTLFKGATFDLLTSTILFAVITQLSVQVAGSVASMLSPRLLTNTFIVVIAGGVILAMLSNQNLYWWKRSLSFLGTTHATDSWEFNAALIFAGLILVALIDYLFVSLKRVFPGDKRLLIMRILLTLLAINLAAVGLFPNDDALHLIHVRVAGNLVYIIIALIVGVKWLLPNITKEFRQISWLMAGGLVATEILFEIVGYLSLTAFEILAFLLAFSWTIMLFERLNDYLEPSQMDIYEVK